MIKKEEINLINFLPNTISVGKYRNKSPLNSTVYNNYISISYITKGNNNASKEYSFTLPLKIEKSKETFEVLGLLQAEMGKTQNGCLVFSNSEPKIINKIIKWFDKEFGINKNLWKWYIKVDIQKPGVIETQKRIEDKLINYWINNTNLTSKQSYPAQVSYRNVDHINLKNNYYGCLIIEFKNNLFSQVLKSFLKHMLDTISYENKEYIRGFIKGILAGEACIECNQKIKKFRVHLTAVKEKELKLYYDLLKKININCKCYQGYKDLIISEKENLIQLLNQRLMTLHPRKYNKFRNMMLNYHNIKNRVAYFKPKGQIVWNKIPEEKIDQILYLYKSGITNTNEIAKKLEISRIKVQRILKENNLGKRLTKITEQKKKEMSEFAFKNPKLTQKQISQHFNVHESVVTRALKKYGINRGNISRYKIPEEKIQKIVEIYKNNPVIKYSEIIKEVGVSSSVVKRVRKENKLMHLGYKYLIGCNNPNRKI